MLTLSLILVIAAIILAIVVLCNVSSRVNLLALAVLFLGLAHILPGVLRLT